MTRPLGRISPLSSKRTTPLHNRLHPCSGWLCTTWAASRPALSAEGQPGWWGHMAFVVLTLSYFLNRAVRASGKAATQGDADGSESSLGAISKSSPKRVVSVHNDLITGDAENNALSDNG